MNIPSNWASTWQPAYYYPLPNPNVYVLPQGLWNVDPYGPLEPPASRPRSVKYPNLHPTLAADTTFLRFDVRKKPRTEINASVYHALRNLVATGNGVTSMRLISKAFPWSIDINSTTPIIIETIWEALYAALQEYIADSEWGLIVSSRKQREATERAFKKRLEEDPGSDKRLKRIDFLGNATFFKGFEKDGEFEKVRLLQTTPVCRDTWVVKLGSL